ncbi:hypothetical protein OEZ86_009304 [Tetradesmus obliquus]|nr:hypothetical protein OEZ86_009304 [Tetradesmus obliquus]
MRKDPCYYKYEEALQCLDKNDYQQDLCAEAFQAFKACRAHQMTTGVTATNLLKASSTAFLHHPTSDTVRLPPAAPTALPRFCSTR